MTLCADQLLDMSQEQLDDLFRQSSSGEIPNGEGDGIYIVAPGTEISEVVAKFINIFVWKGKVFDPEHGILYNLILPIGIKAMAAKVYKERSWLDQKECIVVDYSETSLVNQWIRDELREVSPGLYLGIVYWDTTRLINFALTFPAPIPNQMTA